MSKDARFRVDSRLASLLGENYRSTELALRELVDNAWDSDATLVWIELPDAMSTAPIVIQDDGSGMTEQEVRQEYLNIANDRRSRRGDLTRFGNRPVKGRKGVGKFAGLMVAGQMNLETFARGRRTRLEVSKADLLAAQELESIDLPISSDEATPDQRGTKVTLSDLNQSFAFPNAERLRQILILEYGRTEGFLIHVNGQPLKIEDIPGQNFAFEQTVDAVGAVKMNFTVSERGRSLKQSGLVLRVQGKLVGRPSYFGLEDDPTIPHGLLRKVYGEVQANGLADVVTADWGAVIENSVGYEKLVPFVREHLRSGIREVHRREVQQMEAKLRREVEERVAQLPEHRRERARWLVNRAISRVYGENPERVRVVVSLVLDAMEKDEYFLVVQQLEEAHAKDVATLAEALESFGLVDMAIVGRQAQSRLQLLDALDELVTNPNTLEKDVHGVIEKNLWLLGPQYAPVSSNRTLARVIEDYCAEKFTGSRAKDRPDLLLANRLDGDHLLIELKRPSLSISREHERQAIEYRDHLTPRFGKMDILILGKGRAESASAHYDNNLLRVASFQAIISSARTQFDWLLDELGRDSS